ncbi:outer membrane protein TolC [Silvibacterium bohemicum]|uniref:Outer membrane protein TolC n=1 Tax=Silvibacterium bohemicum TaxID=1577686 RepID=A0A841K0P1_9BACT|nr:TolC family protein [Silvibacterium bohemicum]MBB6147343.1 outer membrane protein TolC [Silvibacterium bohemicum]
MLALLCLPPSVCAQTADLSMEDAIQLALAHNRSIQLDVLDVARADANVKAASTRRLPSFSVLADGGESLTRPYLDLTAGSLGTSGGAPFPQQALRLNSSRTPSAFVFGQVLEPLTGQYQLGLEIKALKVGHEISNLRMQRSQQEIVNQVRKLYCQIVDDDSAIKTAEADVRLYSELERVTKIYVAEKAALLSDLLGIQGHLLHAKYDETSASNTLATDKEELNAVLGRPIEAEMTLDSDLGQELVLPSQAEAVERAMALRPDLKVAGLQVEQADLNRRAKKAEYIPDVSIEGSYVALTGASLPIGGPGYAEVGVQLRWEPFDWGRKHHELAEKSAIVSQARLNATDLQAKMSIEVNLALRNARAASQLLQAEKIDAEGTDEALRIAQEKYAQHAVLLDEVLKLESIRQRTRQSLLQASSSVQTTYAELRKAMGEDE